MPITLPKTDVQQVDTDAVNQDSIVQQMFQVFDGVAVTCVVIDRDLTTPPGGESDGDIYIVAATGTDEWTNNDNSVAFYYNGWLFATPTTDWRVWVQDEAAWIRWDGTAWVEDDIYGSVATGLTASTTQTQAAGTAITAKLNVFSTVSNPNDAATLPLASTGKELVVANNTANTLQVFPGVGDKIDGGTLDASISMAAGARQWFVAQDATDWVMIP